MRGFTMGLQAVVLDLRASAVFFAASSVRGSLKCSENWHTGKGLSGVITTIQLFSPVL